MNREGIRRLAAEPLGLPISPYRFVDTEAQLREAIAGGIGYSLRASSPSMLLVGQGLVGRSGVPDDVAAAWRYA